MTRSATTGETPAAIITDGLVALREWSMDDVDFITSAFQDPEMKRWLFHLPQEYTKETAREWVVNLAERRASGAAFGFAVCNPTTLEPAGAVEIFDISVHHSLASAGYWTHPAMQGRGSATRGLRLGCRFAFEELGLFKLQLSTDVDNVASQRVADGAGFAREGLLRSHIVTPHGRRDMYLYGRLRSEGGESDRHET